MVEKEKMKKIIILAILTLLYQGCSSWNIKDKGETFELPANSIIVSPYPNGCIVMSKEEYKRLRKIKPFENNQNK